MGFTRPPALCGRCSVCGTTRSVAPHHLCVPGEPGPSGLVSLHLPGPGRVDRGPARAWRTAPSRGAGAVSRLPPVLRRPSGLAAGPLFAPAGGGVSFQLGAASPHGQRWGLATTIFGDTQRAPSARRNSAKGVCFPFFFSAWMDKMFLLWLSSRLNYFF